MTDIPASFFPQPPQIDWNKDFLTVFRGPEIFKILFQSNLDFVSDAAAQYEENNG